MSEYHEIQAQIAELQRRADAIRASERTTAIANIKSLMAMFEISASELSREIDESPRARTHKTKAHVQKVAPKYRDIAGNEWSGRGLQPRWLKAAIANGMSAESFLIS